MSEGDSVPNGQMLSAQQQKQLLRADNRSQTKIHRHEVAPDRQHAVVSSCRSPSTDGGFTGRTGIGSSAVIVTRESTHSLNLKFYSSSGTHSWKIIWQADFLRSNGSELRIQQSVRRHFLFLKRHHQEDNN